MQTRKGQSIEDASMQIIEAEMGPHDFSVPEWNIVRRVIHTTADFDFAGKNSLLFSKHAIKSGTDALRKGCDIVTDVNGVIGGMNKQNPKKHSNNVICRISDADVMQEAKARGLTRAQASMRKAAENIDGGIVAIGNAPTALLEVLQMIREQEANPALVIGIPVGFINASESKQLLSEAGTQTEFISNMGRKGGSAVAAAIINALYKLI